MACYFLSVPLRKYLWNRHDVYFRSWYLLGDYIATERRRGGLGRGEERRGCSGDDSNDYVARCASAFFPWRLDVAAPVFRHQPFYGTTLDASSVSTNVPYRSATSTRINEIFRFDERKKRGGRNKEKKNTRGGEEEERCTREESRSIPFPFRTISNFLISECLSCIRIDDVKGLGSIFNLGK